MGDVGKIAAGCLGGLLIASYVAATVFGLPVESADALLVAGLLLTALFFDYAWLS